tara:strand:+ start:752 stop:952 length:201 start_codon:yes stop_codon:yes gene_type:complete
MGYKELVEDNKTRLERIKNRISKLERSLDPSQPHKGLQSARDLETLVRDLYSNQLAAALIREAQEL